MAAEDAKELNLDDPVSTHGSLAPPTRNTDVVQEPLSTSIPPLLPIAVAMISSAEGQVQPQEQHEQNTSWAIDPAAYHGQVPGVQPLPYRRASNQYLQQQQQPQQQIQQNNTAPSLQHSNLPGGGDNTPHPQQQQQHTVVLPLEHLDLIEADTQFDRTPSRPRRLLNSVSKSLPVLLTVTVAYIYYVYIVRVCITYLIMDQNQALQGGLYLAVFNILILLFSVSYYQSIFTRPGSPSNPPSSRSPPSIPPTTTPYQSQSPGPTRSGSDDRISSHVSVTSPAIPTPPSRAHQSPHVAPVVTTPKYLSSAIAPTMPSFAASSEAEYNNSNNKDDHVVVIPDNTSTRSHRPSIDFSASGPTSSMLPHGSARSRVHIEDDALQRPLATLSVSKRDGRSRWCEICKIVKPDRCHHCSECNMCVLRMDHHCPWVNGCVGFGNYKQFYLFILYGSLSAVWCVGSMIPLLVNALESQGQGPSWKGNWAEDATRNFTWSKVEISSVGVVSTFDIQWVVITVIAFLLALLIVSFTMVHTRYILGNQTTIESLQNQRNMHVKVQYRKREQQPPPPTTGRDAVGGGGGGGDGVAGLPPFISDIQYNVVMVEQGERLWDQGSWLANWKSIMGPTWWLWFVPYWNSQGDGIHDIYSANVYKRLLADALAQARMQAMNFGGVVRDLAGEELTGPTPSGSLSSPSNSPTSPTRPKIGTFGSQSKMPVVPSTSSGSTTTSPIVRQGSTRKRVATSPAMLIRLQYDGPEASGSRRDAEMQLRQGVASSMDSQGGPDASVDDGSMVAQGGGQRSVSGVSTPRQNSILSQSPRQPRTPQSRPQESGNMGSNHNGSRRRQRTMSGGTSRSYGYGGPIKEFGLGLAMDGIPVDSGTGLKLSTGLLGRSSHGHLRQERGSSSSGGRQPRANQ